MFCFSLNSLRTTVFSAAVCIISDLSRTFYYSKSVSWCSMCSIVPYVISYNSYITNYCPRPLSAPPPLFLNFSLRKAVSLILSHDFPHSRPGHNFLYYMHEHDNHGKTKLQKQTITSYASTLTSTQLIRSIIQ